MAERLNETIDSAKKGWDAIEASLDEAVGIGDEEQGVGSEKRESEVQVVDDGEDGGGGGDDKDHNTNTTVDENKQNIERVEIGKGVAAALGSTFLESAATQAKEEVGEREVEAERVTEKKKRDRREKKVKTPDKDDRRRRGKAERGKVRRQLVMSITKRRTGGEEGPGAGVGEEGRQGEQESKEELRRPEREEDGGLEEDGNVSSVTFPSAPAASKPTSGAEVKVKEIARLKEMLAARESQLESAAASAAAAESARVATQKRLTEVERSLKKAIKLGKAYKSKADANKSALQSLETIKVAMQEKVDTHEAQAEELKREPVVGESSREEEDRDARRNETERGKGGNKASDRSISEEQTQAHKREIQGLKRRLEEESRQEVEEWKKETSRLKEVLKAREGQLEAVAASTAAAAAESQVLRERADAASARAQKAEAMLRKAEAKVKEAEGVAVGSRPVDSD